WKMFLSPAPAIACGPSKWRTTNGAGGYISGVEKRIQRQSIATGVHLVVARGGALLSAAGKSNGRGAIAPCALGGDRRGLSSLLAAGSHGYGQLPAIFLCRGADHDRAVYLDLHHDVCD